MITLTLWGTEDSKVNIMKDTYFNHNDCSTGTCVRVVKDGQKVEFLVKESFGEVNQLLKGGRT